MPEEMSFNVLPVLGCVDAWQAGSEPLIMKLFDIQLIIGLLVPNPFSIGKVRHLLLSNLFIISIM